MEVRSQMGPFGIVPRWVRLALKDNARALALYLVLAELADYTTGEARLLRQRLADELGCSLDTIDRTTATLVDIGALTVRHRNSARGCEANEYVVHQIPPIPAPQEDPEPAPEPGRTDAASPPDLAARMRRPSRTAAAVPYTELLFIDRERDTGSDEPSPARPKTAPKRTPNDPAERRQRRANFRPEDCPADFRQWWDAYPHRQTTRPGGYEALASWSKLTDTERATALATVKPYAKAIGTGYAKDPHRWLDNGLFHDYRPATTRPLDPHQPGGIKVTRLVLDGDL